MKRKLVYPNQIVTLRDYPLHNEHILKIYFRIFHEKQGKILPPAPVIHKSVGIPIGKDENYNSKLANYLKQNPNSEFFLLDGGHKTTAATLAHQKIPVLLIEKDQDLTNAKKLVEKGELFGWHSIKNTISEMLQELADHHLGCKSFLTVEEKTKKMVEEKIIPDYMISNFQQK